MGRIYLALNRFGLGARRDEAPPSDPQRWLLGQLGTYNPHPAAIASAPARSEVGTQLADYIAEVRGASLAGLGPRARQAAQMRPAQPNSMMEAGEGAEALAG